MNALNALRQRATCHASTRPLTRLMRPNATPIASRLLANRPQWHRQPSLLRCASDAAQQARAKALYPETINVYRAGTNGTVGVGMMRVGTIVLWALGTFFYAPNFYFSPDHSNWLAPAFALAGGIPFFVVALATGPMVHAIKVHLPRHARRTKLELRQFSANTPKETELDLQYMRFAPWPVTRRVRFDRLRRLKPSLRGGIANLEHLPAQDEGAKAREEYKFANALLKRYMGRFYVNRRQAKDRAQVPGVWEGMWEQIPWEGSEEDPKEGSKRVERGPVVMRGRPVIKR